MQAMTATVLSCLLVCGTTARSEPVDNDLVDARSADSELSYTSYVHSSKRIKCLYGYAANKTGDHAAAIEIFNDCIERWNDVFSMLGLAQMYETGIGIEQNFAKSAELIKRAAYIHDGTSYPSLARFHYGVALAEGCGVARNRAEARVWLGQAAAEGIKEAAEYLRSFAAPFPAPETHGQCGMAGGAPGHGG